MTSRMRIHAELEGKIRSHKHEAMSLGIKNSRLGARKTAVRPKEPSEANHREKVGLLNQLFQATPYWLQNLN